MYLLGCWVVLDWRFRDGEARELGQRLQRRSEVVVLMFKNLVWQWNPLGRLDLFQKIPRDLSRMHKITQVLSNVNNLCCGTVL